VFWPTSFEDTLPKEFVMDTLNGSEVVVSEVPAVTVTEPVVETAPVEPVLPVTEVTPEVLPVEPVSDEPTPVLPVTEVTGVELVVVTAPAVVPIPVTVKVRRVRQPRQHVTKPKAEKRMGRPPVYVGKIAKYIVKLIKTHNASNARKILAARSNSKLVQYRDLELVPSPLRVSMPTLCKLAKNAGVSHGRGRPAKAA
jgi:hypothetical protein